MSFFAASAYTMPADQLVQLSNRELAVMGQAHWDKNELDSALICFSIVSNRGDQKLSKEDKRLVCGTTTVMGIIYKNSFYDYERAMQCLLKSEKLSLKFGFNNQLVDLYEAMAQLEQDKNDIEHDYAFNIDVLNLHKKSFNLAIQHHVEHAQVLSIINMITIAMGHQRLDLIQKELQLFQSAIISDTVQARDFAKQLCIGAICLSKSQYAETIVQLSKLDSCLLTLRQSAKPRFEFITHAYRFYTYRDMNNHTLALQELDTMEQIVQEHGFKEGMLEVLIYKRDYYAAQGNTNLANDFDTRYFKAKDQLMAEAKVAKADEEKVLFKLNEANHEIKELSYKQRIQQTELIAVAIVAVLLMALLLLAWLSHRRTKQKNRSLYEQNQQLLANIDRVRQMRKEQDAPAEKYGRGKMEGDDISQVMEKVERVMDESEEIYSTEFSLDRLAELAGETESRVSQAINTSGHKYYELLNEYRVREACRRLDDKTHSSGLTIEAIGQSVGFKSRSNFVATFKRLTGLTPSAYLKQPSKAKKQPD
jgi:AraC-like DNA-binding protein